MTVSGVPQRTPTVAEGKAFPCLSASNQTALPRLRVGGRFLSVKKCSQGRGGQGSVYTSVFRQRSRGGQRYKVRAGRLLDGTQFIL